MARKESSIKIGNFAFLRGGRSSSPKQADHAEMSKKAFNSISTSTVVESPDLVSPTSPISSGKKDSRNHRTGP
jgi:hypothetical protein